MKKIRSILSLFKNTIILLWLCSVAPSEAQNSTRELLITTEVAFPTNMSDDSGKTIYGSSADKVHELLRRSQIPYRMEIMSWNRAFELARNTTDTCVFSTARTREREALFKWIGPIGSGTSAIFGSPDKLGKVNSIDDIIQGNIGGYLGDEFVSYIAAKGAHVIVSYEPATALKNVAQGRLDYVAFGDKSGEHFIIENHLENKVVLLFRYQSIDLYLACNPGIDDTTVKLMNSTLDKMKKDGTYKKIDSKYH